MYKINQQKLETGDKVSVKQSKPTYISINNIHTLKVKNISDLFPSYPERVRGFFWTRVSELAEPPCWLVWVQGPFRPARTGTRSERGI